MKSIEQSSEKQFCEKSIEPSSEKFCKASYKKSGKSGNTWKS